MQNINPTIDTDAGKLVKDMLDNGITKFTELPQDDQLSVIQYVKSTHQFYSFKQTLSEDGKQRVKDLMSALGQQLLKALGELEQKRRG